MVACRACIFSLFVCTAFLYSCSTDFEVLAPEKDIYVVYCVLNPQETVQYVRVSKVFSPAGDALQYAAENDVTVSGLQLQLKGGGKVYAATEEKDIPRDEGIFSNVQTLYVFHTSGPDSLLPGGKYILEISGSGTEGEIFITAETEIPTVPVLIGLDGPLLMPDGQYSFPVFAFEETNNINFERGSGHGFDIRIRLQYQRNGSDTIADYGPTTTFKRSRNCGNDSEKSRELCFELPACHVLNGLLARLHAVGGSRSYYSDPQKSKDPDQLNHSLHIEVTAADSFLTKYMYSSIPAGFGLNLLIDKKEYNNISGEHIGLFGSINSSKRWIYMSECSKYLAGLTVPVLPPSGCEWQ